MCKAEPTNTTVFAVLADIADEVEECTCSKSEVHQLVLRWYLKGLVAMYDHLAGVVTGD